MKDDRLHLRLPEPKYSNYVLMQTINDAISLSLEEKKIEDEMAKIAKENEIDTGKPHKGNNGSSLRMSVLYVFVSVCSLFKIYY